MKNLLFALLAGAAVANAAQAQDLLAEKPIHTLGDAKVWTAGDQSYTFVTADLPKLVAVPTNTDNVYLYPENGTLNTAENQAIGIQGFYVDMETSQEVGQIVSTWEGAAANAYSVWLTDAVPTLDILNTTPTHTESNLGQYTKNQCVLPKGSKGRYLVFQPTDATNWGWGVKMRSISAYAPVEDVLTTFTVVPAFAIANQQTELKMTFTNQIGSAIAADKVTVTVSDNATLNGNYLIINSGDKATLTATFDGVSLTADVYVPTAPEVPAMSSIKTAIFTNTKTDDNGTAQWETAYNGAAQNLGTITFPDGEVAQAFADTRCVFFSNTVTTGEWNGDIDPTALGYRKLHMDVYGTKAVTGQLFYEKSALYGGNHYQEFTLTPGEWTSVDLDLQGETLMHSLSVRFAEDQKCDVLLANIYFTPAYVEGDEEAPVLSDVTADAGMTSVKLSFTATDDKNTDISYSITNGSSVKSVAGKSGEAVEYTFDGLEPETEYNFTVTASDGKNVSEPKSVKVTTTGFPAAPAPTLPAAKVSAIYSATYGATTVPTFDQWGSAAVMSTIKDDKGGTLLSFSNYNGQWGGLTGFSVNAENGEYLHIDIYNPGATGNLTVAPVWENVTGSTPDKTIQVEGGKWNSFNIPLADFNKPEDGATAYQLAMTNSQLPAFAVDNLYFWWEKTADVVGEIGEEADGVAAWYTLQGVRVAEPSHGLYIRVQNGKSTKVFVK